MLGRKDYTREELNAGVLQVANVFKRVPEQMALKLKPGDAIKLTEDALRRLSAAFFAELEHRSRQP